MGKTMATILHKDEILKAAQAMSKEERLKLIAEIAALPEVNNAEETITEATAIDVSDFDKEVLTIARQVMDKYDNLFRQLAEWPEDISPKNK